MNHCSNKMLKLSIIFSTYNHEKYVAQALESIFMQKVDFDYELIILEDCSTDKTREIILKYKDKFENIKLFFNKKNYGVRFSKGISRRFCHFRGKYTITLEGDDYWTDPNKLQQQVDFLEKNPTFIGCSHNTELFYEKENKRKNMLECGKIKSINDIMDLIDGNCYFHTSSYVWRNIFKDAYPKAMCYNKTLMGDFFLSMLYAKHGKIKYINKVMSCYRITGAGIWSKLSEYQQNFNNIRGLYVYNKLLNYEYSEEFNKRIWWACWSWFNTIRKDEKFSLIDLKVLFLRLSIDFTKNQHIYNFFNMKNKVSNRILSSSKIVDKLIMKLFAFLFNCFSFFDINRYYLYYKIKFYNFFKINIYKDVTSMP